MVGERGGVRTSLSGRLIVEKRSQMTSRRVRPIPSYKSLTFIAHVALQTTNDQLP